MSTTSIRKPHNQDAGYVASRKCSDGGHAVIYRAKDQGIDADSTYVVVKFPQGQIVEASNRDDAYFLMKDAAGEQLNKWWTND